MLSSFSIVTWWVSRNYTEQATDLTVARIFDGVSLCGDFFGRKDVLAVGYLRRDALRQPRFLVVTFTSLKVAHHPNKFDADTSLQ